MSDYSAQHAAALAALQAKGAAVSFVKVEQGTHNPETETYGEPTLTSVDGWAIEVKSDQAENQNIAADGLVLRQPVTLLFAANTFGEVPAIGSTGSWAGTQRTVHLVRPLRPDGTAIISRVLVVT